MFRPVIPVIFILFLFISNVPGISENYYKWVDEQGVTHVTDNPQKIPPRYRSNHEVVKEKETGFQAYKKNLKKQINNNKTTIIYALTAIIGLIIISRLLKKMRSGSSAGKRSRFDEAMKKSGIDLMSIPQFRDFTRNLLIRRGYKITEMKSDLDLGIDYIAEKSGKSYLVKVISDSITTSHTLLNDLMRDTTRYGCDKVLVITKNFFSDDAIKYSKSSPCDLIDRNELGKWIKESGI